jgi:hypothetical protein
VRREEKNTTKDTKGIREKENYSFFLRTLGVLVVAFQEEKNTTKNTKGMKL